MSTKSRNGGGLRNLTVGVLAVTVIGAAAVKPAAADDVKFYNHPNRPKSESAVRTARATLIGYDANAGELFVSPFVVVRFGGEDRLTRVYLADGTTIDGVRFSCPDQRTMASGIGFPVCPRLPSALALKLPVAVDIAVWRDSLDFSKDVVLGTDMIAVVTPASH